MNLDKLKESARKYEQSGQWRPAIDVYKKALREFEESGEGMLDPSLYNRIGDLEMKDSESGAAIRAYEQAADLYTEQGFFNNAIALCGKILRINPARTSTYLRLAQLNARKNFVSDGKKNLVEYLERMEALHHRDEAVAAIKAFSNQFSGNPDIRVMLVELLRGSSRGDGSTESLDRLADELEDGGESSGQRRTPDRIVARDGPAGASGLVFLDVGHGADKGKTRTIGDEPVEGLDLGRPDEDSEEAWRRDTSSIDGIDQIDPALADEESLMPEIIVDGETIGFAEEHDLIGIEVDPFADDADGGRSIDGLDLVDTTLDAHAAGLPPDGPPVAQAYDTLDEAARAAPVPPEVDDLVFLDVDGEPSGVAPDTDPAVLARDRARVLLEVGDRVGAVAALETAIEGFETTGRFDDALQAAHDLTRLEPDSVFRFQKRVELAYRSGRRDVMLDAYLQLADALQRSGGVEHALTVYRRVLEHDTDNAEARDAIARLSAPEPPPPDDSFIDLGSLILDEPQARDTRIRVDQAAPIEDEDQAFLEALEQFKRGIDENIDAEDFQAHYDLGIAFKEMGLLDEAIAQFQKALRSPEGRLKTSEQLGISFYDKSRFAIAEAVLRRAIDSLPGGDEDKIGLIYWLGRSVEAQRRHDEAVRCFERVLAVDIRFLDVGERVQRLTSDQQ